MKKEQLSKFLKKQKDLIDKCKWEEGIRINSDPGQSYVSDWVKKNASKFRKSYTKDELAEAQAEIADMKNDLENSVIDIRKLKKYLEDIQEKIDMAKETLEEKEDE
jgi:hypothetical protein